MVLFVGKSIRIPYNGSMSREEADELLTVDLAAQEKGVHRNSIYRAIKAGRLAAEERYGVILIRRDQLQAWKPKGPGPRKRT